MSCRFSLFPHLHISFPPVTLDFKLFNQNIPNKMISKKKTSTLKNLEVATCYSKDFSKEFRSNLTYFKNNWFRELISRNYLNVIKCVIIFYCKSNNKLQSHSNHDIVFNCNFWYSSDYIKYFMPSILNTAQYFPRYIEWRSIRDFIHTGSECVSVYSRILVCTVYPRICQYSTRV